MKNAGTTFFWYSIAKIILIIMGKLAWHLRRYQTHLKYINYLPEISLNALQKKLLSRRTKKLRFWVCSLNTNRYSIVMKSYLIHLETYSCKFNLSVYEFRLLLLYYCNALHEYMPKSCLHETHTYCQKICKWYHPGRMILIQGQNGNFWNVIPTRMYYIIYKLSWYACSKYIELFVKLKLFPRKFLEACSLCKGMCDKKFKGL